MFPPDRVFSPKSIMVFNPSIPAARLKYLMRLPFPFSLCLNTNFLFMLKFKVLLISLAPTLESTNIREVGRAANNKLRSPYAA